MLHRRAVFPNKVKKIAKAVFFVCALFTLTALSILLFYVLLPGSISTTVLFLALATIPSSFVVSIATAMIKSWFTKVFHDTFTLTSELVASNFYQEEVAKNEVQKVKENYATWQALHNEHDLEAKVFELLKTAIENGHFELFEFFLEKINPNIDFTDTQGNTALHYAIQHHRYDIIKRLLKDGANRTIKNKMGLTAQDLVNQKCVSESLQQSHLYNMFHRKYPSELCSQRRFSLVKTEDARSSNKNKSIKKTSVTTLFKRK